MDFQEQRHQMVDRQIIARGITDARVIDVMRRVPRHEFVPKNLRGQAYEDCPLPIGEGQTISQPYIVALMTQCLQLDKNDRVLEIGTGSGYQTAILAELSKEVRSIERIKVLAEHAKKKLDQLNYKNVKILLGDGSLGEEDNLQFFNAIMVTAASPKRPDHLFMQLASGGKLVAPVGGRSSQALKFYRKTDNDVMEEDICGCTFVPLIGTHGWSS